jgi:hypothetical protein
LRAIEVGGERQQHVNIIRGGVRTAPTRTMPAMTMNGRQTPAES